jgi:ornithine cyclodeaminase/alanine dehydrogenase-like protein (mu-crystallin family)
MMEGRSMVLLLTNGEVQQVLDMKHTLEALEILYKELGEKQAVFFPRQDVHVPLARPEKGLAAHYLKVMGGASPAFGTVALRLSSDVCIWPLVGGLRRRKKLPVLNGKWLGLILLFSSVNGELLAIIQDGYLSRMRVGGTNGLAAKVLARAEARRVGLFGSGWQAGAQLLALAEVRKIESVKVYSPTPEHRERFSEEMEERLGIPVKPVDRAEEAAREVDIIVTATNSRQSFFPAEWMAAGVHMSCLQRDEMKEEAYRRCDVLVINTPEMESNFTSSLFKEKEERLGMRVKDHPWSFDLDWRSYPTLGELVTGKAKGRTNDAQITGFVNNIGLGAQFAAVGARVYELAKAKGLGMTLESDLFLEDIHP